MNSFISFLFLILFFAEAQAQLSCFDLLNHVPRTAEYKQIKERFKNRPFYETDQNNHRTTEGAHLSPLNSEELSKIPFNIFSAKENLPAVIETENLEFFKRTGLLHENFDADSRWVRNPELAITIGSQSRSIIRAELGENVVRDYSWLRSENGINLDRVHVARNYKTNGEPFSMEMLIHDGQQWRAFYFESEGNYWKIKDKFKNQEVEKVCLRCHRSRETGRMSPKPIFMSDKSHWFRSGFKDEDLIRRLLKF